jgi:hypothetical protein
MYVGIKKGTNNNWTYDVIDHLMISLEIILALSFVTYITRCLRVTFKG